LLFSALPLPAVLGSVVPASAQTLPGLLRGPYLQSPTPSSVVVRWRSGVPSDSRVRYGTDPGALDLQVTVPGLVIDHQVTLTGLEPETRYYYAVGSSLADLSGGPDHTFLTPPPAGSRRPVRIWTFGDSGLGPALGQADQVRDAYLNFTGGRGTDVWVLLGDNAYLEATDPEYQVHFFDYYPSVLRQVPAWSTFGNHEGETASSSDESGPYYEIFTFPKDGEAGGEPSGREAYYAFDYANIHFVCLNSFDIDRSSGGEMAEWLRRDLAANTQEWTIAFFHHPAYSFGTHNSDTETELIDMRENLLPILEEGGVDLVLVGHSHNYERSVLLDGHYGLSGTLTPAMKLDAGKGRLEEDGPYRKTGDVFGDAHSGTVHVTSGAGAEARTFNRIHPAMAAVAEIPGSLVIDIDGSRLDARFIALDGSQPDHFTMLRGEGFNFPPVALDDEAATAPLVPVAIPVLANDFDPDHDLLLIEAVGSPAHGSAVANPDGTVTYTPAADFAAGTDVFSYAIADGHGHTDHAAVRVTVACPPVGGGVFADDLEPQAEAGSATVTIYVVAGPADRKRLRAHGDIDDGSGAARLALHARLDDDGDSDSDSDGGNWIRYRTLYPGGVIDLEGWIGSLSFPTTERAELSGVCWLADGSPCTFIATAEDHAHPGAGADRFEIEVFDHQGQTIYAAEGVLIKGQVKID
jgi:hypothetical protein